MNNWGHQLSQWLHLPDLKLKYQGEGRQELQVVLSPEFKQMLSPATVLEHCLGENLRESNFRTIKI